MNFLSNLNPVIGMGASLAVGMGAKLALMPLSVYMHELGHACAVKLLFDGAKPKIELEDYGYSGGVCYKNIDKASLSKFGRLMGRDRALAIIAAAGPLVDITTSIALRCLIPNRPEIVGFCLFSNIFFTIYALTAFEHLKVLYTGKRSKSALAQGHDFLELRIKGGLLPTAALITASVGLSILSGYDLLTLIKNTID